MSVRSFKRAHARRQAREQRRASTLKRKGSLIAGLALSSSALLAANAQAATTYTVTTTGDGPPAACTGTSCLTLRDALTAANTDGGTNTIDLSGLSGVITLTNGVLPITDGGGLYITGPGASTLAIDGQHLSQDVYVNPGNGNSVTITGLTITNGTAPSGTPGGAIGTTTDNTKAPDLTLTSDVISNSTTADSHGGGGIFSEGSLSLTGSTVTGNVSTNASSATGGGVSAPRSKYLSPYRSRVTVANSTISGNTSANYGGGIGGGSALIITDSKVTGNHLSSSFGLGGGIDARGSVVRISGTTVSGNSSNEAGGGVFLEPKYGGTLTNSAVSGNTAPTGGGMLIVGATFGFKYNPITVKNSTISGNQARNGGGVYASVILDKVSIQGSTLSGNTGGAGSAGGGLLVGGPVYGNFDVSDSTISGNTADTGGGVTVGFPNSHNRTLGTKYGNAVGSIGFDNTTIAANTANAHAGGIYLSQYKTSSSSPYRSAIVGLTSAIVAGNTAAGTPDDLERGGSSTTGGFNGAFSLVQSPGGAPLSKNAVITGVNPQLGPLAANGGPTLTMLPSGTSPVIDQGHAPTTTTTDQRGLQRTVDTAITNPPGGDGTDIGAVELPAGSVVVPPLPPPSAPTPTSGLTLSIRGASLSLSSRRLLVGNQTPVTCAVKAGTLNSCVIEVRGGGKLLGSGEVTSTNGVTSLTTMVTPTKAGLAYLKHRQLGVDATATVVASQSAAGLPFAIGNVHFLQGPSIMLGLGKRSAKLSKNVVSELDRVAKLLAGTKSFTCTAFADKAKGDVSLTKSEAGAACTRLKKDGLSGKSRVVGRGHASPVASNQNRKGRAANRRVVISFSF